MKISVLTLLVFASLIGCKKDEDPEPSAAEKQAVLLAGVSGQSKTWILTGYKTDDVTDDNFVCLENNEYTFSNNASQEFSGDEGEERCVDSNQAPLPQSIESGNWAFALDGKTVIISSLNVTSPIAIFSYYTTLGRPFPAKIISLNEKEFVIEIEYSTPDFSETARISFEAM
jgi:hypothetical protein